MEPSGRVVHTLLAELQRVTGLESTYVTRIDDGVQEVVRARNTGRLDIPVGTRVAWSDTVCRLALERGQPYAELWHVANQEIPPLSARLLAM